MQKFIAYIYLTFLKYLMLTFGWAAYPSYQVPKGAQGAFPACQMYIMMILYFMLSNDCCQYLF